MSLNANKDFAIVGDGFEHNTLPLIQLRDHVRAGPDRIWHVEFEPGHYAYTDERWALFGNRTVVLEFNNSTVECRARPLLPLGAGPIQWMAPYPTAPTTANSTFHAGHLIETAEVRAAQVRLKTAAPGHFAPGDAVLVAGLIQQFTADGGGWGWPPNFRYFEWKVVADMPDDFTIRFLDPLRYTYDASWPDVDHDFFGALRPYGAPRIWRCRLDDGRHVNRSLTIRNANFVAGRDRAAGTHTALGLNGLHVRLENCATGPDIAVWPTVAKRVELVNCRIGLPQLEMDKIVESCSLDRCELYGRVSSGGASVLDVSFRDVNFYGFVQATPRRSWRFEGACHFYAGVQLSPGLANTPFVLASMASAV